jgi:RecG-like helicase
MEDLLKKYVGIEVTDCNCDEQLLGGKKSEWSLQDEEDFYKSNEVSSLEKQMQSRIQEKKNDLAKAKEVLEEMKVCISNNQFVSMDLLHKNEILYQLISERVRLDIYRKMKNSKAGLKDKETKRLAKQNAAEYMKQMENIYSPKYVIRQAHLKEKLDRVTEILDRNEKSVQKRKEDAEQVYEYIKTTENCRKTAMVILKNMDILSVDELRKACKHLLEKYPDDYASETNSKRCILCLDFKENYCN